MDWRPKDWREPAQYFITRGGGIIRRPYEEFKPITPDHPCMKWEFSDIEQALWDKVYATEGK